MRRALLLLVPWLLASCPKAPVEPAEPIPVNPAVPVVGVEYALPVFAAAMRDSGAVSAKPYPDLKWGEVQPSEGAAYDFSKPDAFVEGFQDAGFRNLTLMVRSDASWADTDPPALGHRGDTMPKPQHEGAWAEFVQALVERYDFDGVDDMPGLRAKVQQYGFEAEFSSFWPGDAASYVKLLGLARPAAQAADSGTKVVAAGLLMTGVFEGYPSQSQIDARLAATDPRVFDKTPADIALLLDHPEVFDAVDFHALGHYSEIPATVSWLRAEMARRAYDKPIWIGDTWGGASLNGWGPAACPAKEGSGLLEYPATEDDRCRVAQTLSDLGGALAKGHAAALKWMRAEAAAGTVRKVALAASLGLAGINMGNVEDWETLSLAQGGAGTSPFQGMLDRNPWTRQVTGKRPSYHALAQIGSVLAKTVKAERLALSDERSYVVRFTRDGASPVLVAWRDAGLWLPDVAMPTGQVSFDAGATGTAQLERTVTEGESAAREPLELGSGAVSLELGPVPVFVWLP